MRSTAALLAVLLLAPLAAPALLLLASFASSAARGGATLGAFESWLLLFGPAVPLYLILIPLAPFLIAAQRRGWSPRAWQLVAAVVALGLLVDLLFFLASRGLS